MPERIRFLKARKTLAEISSAYHEPLRRPAHDVLGTRILIIAELSIPQCAKYRVWQKRAMIESLGVACTVVDWRHVAECRSALQTHSAVIFYRVPAFSDPVNLIHEARRLKVPTIWEVDDLIFDIEKYRKNTNIHDMPAEVVAGIMKGAEFYRKAMLACDAAIASTEPLALAMEQAGSPKTYVIENALDEATLRLGRKLKKPRGAAEGAGDVVRVVYGSGTRTHDADFRAASAALLRVMDERPQVRLRIVGLLNLPDGFSRFADRIERLDLMPYAGYLAAIAPCDINIAPLEVSEFNDAKSNIKFLEAAILGLPSLCSPSLPFREVVEHGRNGFLCAEGEDWYRALLALVDDARLRREIGERAHESALRRYSPDAIARRQVAPFLRDFGGGRDKGLRVLAVNIFAHPRTFGGATIVAEELACRLARRHGAQVGLFAAWDYAAGALDLVRYDHEKTAVFGVKLPLSDHPTFGFENAALARDAFARVVDAFAPDVVHIHAIQNLGVSVTDVCRERGIPYVVTLHDAWWMCGRQFMVRDGLFCRQETIDLDVCASCVPDGTLNRRRSSVLREALDGAAALLAPSVYFKDFHAANGFSNVVVNKNGIHLPLRREPRRLTGRIRFAFVTGGEIIKGSGVVKAAFEGLARDDYELIVVNNLSVLGQNMIGHWNVKGKLSVVPAFSAADRDEFFSGVDVLLFPTLCKESFGLTVREALARNVWVIASDSGGSVEDIVDGENGTVIPLTDDPRPLRAAVEAMLQRPQRLAGYENPHAGSIRSFDEQADELFDLLTDAVENGRAPQELPLAQRTPALAPVS